MVRQALMVVLGLTFLPQIFAKTIQLVSTECWGTISVPDFYQLRWTGTVLPYNCKITIKGDNNVCVRTSYYRVNDCNFELEVRQQDNTLLKKLTCSDSGMQEVCTPVGQWMILNYVNTDVSGIDNYVTLNINSDTRNTKSTAENSSMTYFLFIVALLNCVYQILHL